MANKVDVNRGVMFMVHQATGMYVYMYIDTPGEYFNVHCSPVTEKMASEAGFEIEKYAKEKLKRERLRAASDAIEAEIAIADKQQQVVVEECSGFTIVDIGYSRFNVKDPDGNVLNTHPLSREIAVKLLENLVPEFKEKKTADTE